MGLHKRANTSSMKCTQIVTTSLEKHAIVASKMQTQKQGQIKSLASCHAFEQQQTLIKTISNFLLHHKDTDLDLAPFLYKRLHIFCYKIYDVLDKFVSTLCCFDKTELWLHGRLNFCD